MIVKGNIKMNKFPPIKASTHNNDYTLLESIDIPEKVGVEEVRHIGKVLEQALPNAGDSPKLGHMRLSPNIISLDRDAKIPDRRNNNCIVCFKNRGTFTFQGREHIQMNRRTKGAKIKWYCPLADTQEEYSALLMKRKELKRKQIERSNEKRRAKRRSP